jgi:hypothetical protein
LLDEFKLSLLSDLLRVDLELCLIDLSLSFDQVSLGLRLGIGNRETSGSHALILSFKFPKVLVDFLVLNLRIDLKALKHTV